MIPNSQANFDALSRRLRRVEALCLFMLLALIIAVSVAASSGTSIPDLIRTRRLEVLDSDGKVALIATSADNGDGVVHLRTAAGGTLLIGMGFIEATNDSGRTVVSIGTDDRGNAYFEACPTNGASFFYAGPSETGDAMLEIGTAAGAPVAALSANAAGNGQLKLLGGSGAEGLTATLDANENGFLQVHSPRSRGTVVLGVDEAGDGTIAVVDRTGQTAKRLTSK